MAKQKRDLINYDNCLSKDGKPPCQISLSDG